ncbi:MAG TPA: hypothetical protein VKV05_09805, partial [Terriglobales bacterium]|nr:hypothetical protein [Terriglobales bacterium]
MLTEKQFRERAKSELRQIGNQVQGLAADRDVYWKVEREIIQPNPQLREARSPFLDMLRGCYTDAMAAQMLRLLNGEEGAVSLPRVLAQLADYPQLRQDKITDAEFAADRAALQEAAARLKRALTPHAGHHERTLPALAAMHRELDAAFSLIIETVRTYYWIVAESYLDLDV